MMTKGSQSIAFQEAPYIISSGSVVGKKEGEGPLGKLFDMVVRMPDIVDSYLLYICVFATSYHLV